tara:strand:- start:562 stop:867 length:306 start_codon:yes stop_codon:yes gene_type:complete
VRPCPFVLFFYFITLALLSLLRPPDPDSYLQGSRHTAGPIISGYSCFFLVRLQRLAIVAIVAILAQQEDDLRMDAVDFEAGWDWMELVAAGLFCMVSCCKS